MNPLLASLHPYPFERLNKLFASIKPNPAYSLISLGIGEPRHPTPQLVLDALAGATGELATYPPTIGSTALREACAGWVSRRYGVTLDPATQVLPVNGSREALFAFAQAVIDGGKTNASVICPNPFYQIYEGAALLAGATPYYAASDPSRNFNIDWHAIPAAVWDATQLVYVCSPGNPTGAVMPMTDWEKLFEECDRRGIVIASDECYSEIYFREEAPLGALEASKRLGRA